MPAFCDATAQPRQNHRMSTPLPFVAPASQGFDADRLARVDRFLAERYVEPGRLAGALFVVANGPRRGRASQRARPRLARARRQARRRHDLSHLLDDQAGDERRPHDARRGRPHRARRSGREVDPVVARPRGLPRRLARRLRHRAGRRADAGARPHAPHVGPDLRLPESHQRRRRLSRLAARSLRRRKPREFRRSARPRGRSSSRPAPRGTTASRPTSSAIWSASRPGQPFDAFVRSRILQPLGMVDTDFHVPEAKLARFADCYVRSAAGPLVATPGLHDFAKPQRAPSGGGGLVGTAADYLRFCEMLRRGGELGGVRLLGPKTAGADAHEPPAPVAATSPTWRRPACSRKRPTRASASASGSQ